MRRIFVRCFVHRTQKAVRRFKMGLNDGDGRTAIGIDGELSRQVITVTIFETIAEAVLFRWMILVMEFAPIEDVQDVAGVDLLFRKLLQRKSCVSYS
ncbi:MAG: hypothetical protein LBN39_04780 [Planctomycetaceae bacterium]|jgi:hypothetical protein|nr:hypothetical protein [Planctomycetaceae bacterium]